MVSIVCCTMRNENIENVFQNYENQALAEKELIIVLNNDDMDLVTWKERANQSNEVSIYQLPEEKTLGECLNYGIQKAKYDYIAKFDDDDYYAPNYLIHAIEQLKTVKADVVGKKTIYIYVDFIKTLFLNKPGYENLFVARGLRGATLVFKKQVWDNVKFPHLNLSEDTYFSKECRRLGYKMYSTDRCNYACVRNAPSHHTWHISTKRLKKHSIFICETENYQPYVQCSNNDKV